MEKEISKVCSKCLIEKDSREFNLNKSTKDGFGFHCKKCIKEYYNNNKEKILIRNKKWGVNNPDKLKESVFNWKNNNLYKVKGYHEKWCVNNPEKVKESSNKYYKNNKEKCYLATKIYSNSVKHTIAWRSLLFNSLKRLGQKKETNTIELLGYSSLDLKEYLISLFTEGMSWGNYGEWHIDHIKMVSEFDKETHPSIVNKLSNLRPLWATTREINGVIYEGNLNRNKK